MLLLFRPEAMKVEELVIDGFKSYSVRTVITNWDPQFNAITGLNGSGKSNILDAICFVLGITKTSSLRASNLQDLIYKKGQAGITKASVTITFDNSDKEHSPVIYKNDPKISITRKISVDGPSTVNTKYLINGRKATQKEVANMLESVQLNINNPNFLIMQGKITKMLNMNPKQILSLIEEATGTKAYEKQREKSEEIMKKKDMKLASIKEIRDLKVKPRLNELKKQTEVLIEYKNEKEKLEKLSLIMNAFEYQDSIDVVRNISKPLDESTQKVVNLDLKIKEIQKQIDTLNEELQKIRANNSKSESKYLKELELKEQETQNNLTRLKTLRKSHSDNLNELKRLCKSKEKEVERIQNSIDNRHANYTQLQQSFKREEEELRHFIESLQRKEDLLSTLSTGISSKGSDAGFAAQLRDANQRLSEIKTAIEQDKLKIRHLDGQIDESTLENHKHEIEKYKAEIKRRKAEFDSIKEQLKQSGFDKLEYDKLKVEEQKLLEQLNYKNRSLQEFVRRDTRFDFTYDKPTPDFNYNSVKGLCGELFNLPEKHRKTATALEVCAGFKLFNVVVDTDKTGSLLLEKGRLRKRVTIVPLNKITSKVVRESIVNEAKRQAPNKVELALNLVECDPSVKKAIEYVFGNKLICDDPETAKKVTFSEKIRTGSITLDGDNYDPEGRLSGGSRNTSASLLSHFERYKDLKNEVMSIRKRLDQISETLRRMNIAAEKNYDTQQKLVAEEYHISLLNKKLNESNSAVYIQNYERSMHEIDSLKEMIRSNESKIELLNQEIGKINKDMDEFNSDGSKKLRQLKEEIGRMLVERSQKEKNLAARRMLFNEETVRNEDALLDIENLKTEILKAKEEIPRMEEALKEEDHVIDEVQYELDQICENIQIERDRSANALAEFDQLSQHLQNKKNELSETTRAHEAEVERKGKLLGSFKEAKKVISMLKNDTRIIDDTRRAQLISGCEDFDYEEYANRVNEIQKKIDELKSKGADDNVQLESEILLQNCASLEGKILKIEKDRKKIETTIEKLDQYLKTELNKTYRKVSDEFGETLAMLLPGAYAKLVKTSGEEGNIFEGLEIRVRLGSVWKESLVELSGGQRSLVALALIMALLRYSPAPMYILDEVDAALDLSHTQSIGHLIKTKFKGSQFIVVSLKEGMFTNANKLFKVRFQDGTSIVST